MRLLPHRIWCNENDRVANHRDRPLAIVIFVLFALIPLLISRANAAIHPVPLDKNVDAAKCLECHNSDDNREFGGVGPSGPHGSKWNHLLERRYEFSQAPGPGQRITNLYPNPDLTVNGPYALCGKCHDLPGNIIRNSSWSQHSIHINAGLTCSTCHTGHGMAGRNGKVSGDRLVDFDLNVVAPNGAMPISLQRQHQNLRIGLP